MCHVLAILYMWFNATFAILLTFYHISKLKKLHDLIVGIHRCMTELVTLGIHLAKKSNHIIKMFVVYPFFFFPKA